MNLPRKTVKDAQEQLKRSLYELINAATRYDKGDFDAVLAASTQLRLLFYDKNDSSSLSKLLNLQVNHNFYSYFTPEPNAVVDYGQLFFARFLDQSPLLQQAGYQDVYIFHLGKADRYHKLNFQDWWNEVIFKFDHDQLTRKDIVLAAANSDGGAHYDPKIRGKYQKYYNIRNGLSSIKMKPPLDSFGRARLFGGIYLDTKDEWITPEGIHTGLLRQIIHETLISFSRAGIMVDYHPNLEYNWHRKLNYIGYHFYVKEKASNAANQQQNNQPVANSQSGAASIVKTLK